MVTFCKRNLRWDLFFAIAIFLVLGMALPSIVAAAPPAQQPREVPEADTLLLMGGGLGGLATWLGWQYLKVRGKK